MGKTVYTPSSSEVFDPWLYNSHWDVREQGANTPVWPIPTLRELSFSFPDAFAVRRAFDYDPDFAGLRPATTNVQLGVAKAFSEIAGFTDISIYESGSTKAPIQIAMDPSIDGGYALLPGEEQLAGNISLGTLVVDPVAGNEAHLIIMHEIGHAMGLDHGHEYPEFVASGFDSLEYTVVTYTDYVGDTDTHSYDTGHIDWPQSFMQLDIAAMQFLYGANYASSGELWSGDTTYGFNPNSGEMSINGQGQGAPAGNRIFRTIWDGHGNDTYDLSNYSTHLRVDLSPGAFSTFSQAQLSDLDRYSSDPDRIATGNVANARLVDGDTRALIENVRGGGGNDVIKGNQANNQLDGGAGHDVLDGRDGNDRLTGGLGNDRLYGADDHDRLTGGDGRDSLYGSFGNDSLQGNDGNDVILGSWGRDALAGGNGNDQLLGHQGWDSLYGGVGNDTLQGGDGNDVLYGGSGNDVLACGNGNDWVSGLQGRDHLYGGSGDDTLLGGDDDDVVLAGFGKDELFGGAGNDRLAGLPGQDTLKGGAGDDVLVGGLGADQLYGGLGADRFQFISTSDSNTEMGVDSIHYFQSGIDVIDLSELFDGPATLRQGDIFAPGVASVRTYVDVGITIVEADTNGDGGADFRLELTKSLQLSEADFLL
ncbi:M10 family metallopeptidase C-terminal domain-containing protein [Ruegeria hyattellae]|uniref:M10 family metallopeptidase C-terminal domain-containing protein n=1 Tax=Ruegeria hyattellae TaxID=3233337 RepID=UPI00355C9141